MDTDKKDKIKKETSIMKMFIDTANVDHIREANDLGVICGVTTNPSLIAKEGRDFVEVVKEITTIVDGPISAEVISLDHEGMVKEARELVKIQIHCLHRILKLRDMMLSTITSTTIKLLGQLSLSTMICLRKRLEVFL